MHARQAGAKLAGEGHHTLNTSHCLEHLLGLASDWPDWKAQSYGVSGDCAEPLDCVNTMDTSYNFPAQFGPWAGAIEVDVTGRNAHMAGYTWRDADLVVVHAMADGEWGGTQFRVASATTSQQGANNPILNFSMGGFQQARGPVQTIASWSLRRPALNAIVL